MKKIAMLMAAACLLTMMVGCASESSPGTLSKITYDRGHGSMWGNQFYIEVTEDEIVCARYFSEGSSEQSTCQHIPITAQQWQELTAAVQKLEPELKKDQPSELQKLFKSQKLDGGEYRKLTLSRKTDRSEESVVYQWPASAAAQELEVLLEALLNVC